MTLETALTIRRQFLTSAIAFDVGTDSFKDADSKTQRSNITTAKLLPVINVTD